MKRRPTTDVLADIDAALGEARRGAWARTAAAAQRTLETAAPHAGECGSVDCAAQHRIFAKDRVPVPGRLRTAVSPDHPAYDPWVISPHLFPAYTGPGHDELVARLPTTVTDDMLVTSDLSAALDAAGQRVLAEAHATRPVRLNIEIRDAPAVPQDPAWTRNRLRRRWWPPLGSRS